MKTGPNIDKRGNETREIRTNTTEKQKTIRKHYEQLYPNKLDNLRNKQISRNTLSAKTE